MIIDVETIAQRLEEIDAEIEGMQDALNDPESAWVSDQIYMALQIARRERNEAVIALESLGLEDPKP